MSDSVGKRIRRARLAQHRTLGSVARAARVGEPYVSRIEHDVHTPSPASLKRLATALDLDFDELTILAGRVPTWAIRPMKADPAAAVAALRSLCPDPPKGPGSSR